MEHLVLYRKYRSKNFSEVIGQDHIVKALINQIKNDQISHAYLFCGTRGIGKTSIAKIFARAINCESKTNFPCGKCATCKALADDNNMDILEIDAASNNRVDEIRELRERVKYPPVNGKYKVYIIDEVHMLTDSAFNALLKTLEEPPQYVVFILATTEVQKLPATILSRCMRFDLKLISQQDMEKHLIRIFEDSNIKFENEAISLIATLGEGSVRDALSIAEMCIAYSNNNVTYKSVVECVGITDKNTLYNVTNYLLNNDNNNLLKEIENIYIQGKDLSQLNKDLVSYLKDLAIVKTCKNFEQILKYPKDVFEKMIQIGEKADTNKILFYLQKLSELENEFRYTSNVKSLFEIKILGLNDEFTDLDKLEKRVDEIEKKIKNLVCP